MPKSNILPVGEAVIRDLKKQAQSYIKQEELVLDELMIQSLEQSRYNLIRLEA